MEKNQSYEGYETWLTNLSMQAKMALHISMLFLFLHTSIALVLSYLFYVQAWQLTVTYLLDSILHLNSQGISASLKALQKLSSHSIKYFIYSSPVWLLSPLVFRHFKTRSKKQSADQYIRGAKLITPIELNKDIRKDKEQTFLSIGEVNIPETAEVKHSLIIGRPGSGKTVYLSQILSKLKEKGSKGIVYDFKGDYLSKFYDPVTDLIFNPLDSRGVAWNLFEEIKTDMDIDAISNSLIPDSYQKDPFWHQASRGVLQGLMSYLLQSEDKKTNENLYKVLTLSGVEKAKILKKTPGGEAGATYVEDGKSNQAKGVYATLMQYTHCFKYMSDGNNEFSIEKWLEKESGGMIYVTNYANIQATLRPILSLFVDLLGRKLLSMQDDYNRRVYFLIDELGTLQRLTTIESLLTLSRSKGGSVWLGIQDIGQIEKIYTADTKKTIVNACGTNGIFNLIDPDTSEYFSKKIGEQEYSGIERSQSMGPEDMRDGISLARREKTKRLILPSEISNLRDLECFLKLPNYHLTKTKLEFKSFTNQCESFKLRDGLSLSKIAAEEKIIEHETNKNYSSDDEKGIDEQEEEKEEIIG